MVGSDDPFLSKVASGIRCKLAVSFRVGTHPPKLNNGWNLKMDGFPKPESHGIQGLNFQANQPLNFRDDPGGFLVKLQPFLWSPHLEVSALQELARSFSGGSNGTSCHLAIAG